MNTLLFLDIVFNFMDLTFMDDWTNVATVEVNGIHENELMNIERTSQVICQFIVYRRLGKSITQSVCSSVRQMQLDHGKGM